MDELDDVANAQEFVYRAWEAANRDEARALMDEALSLDPACVDALVWRLFEGAKTADDVIAGLERAIRGGQRRPRRDLPPQEPRRRLGSSSRRGPYLYTRYLARARARARGALPGGARPLPRAARARRTRLAWASATPPSDSLSGSTTWISRPTSSTATPKTTAPTPAGRACWPRSSVRSTTMRTCSSSRRGRATASWRGGSCTRAPRGRSRPRPGFRAAPRRPRASPSSSSRPGHITPQALEWLLARRERPSPSDVERVVRRLETTLGRSAPPWLPRLLAETGSLPEDLGSEVAKADDAAVPWLLALVEDDDLEGTEDPDFPRAPEWAAGLLMALGRTEAAPRLAARLVDLERRDRGASVLARVISSALTAFGPPAVEALLPFLENRASDPEVPLATACSRWPRPARETSASSGACSPSSRRVPRRARGYSPRTAIPGAIEPIRDALASEPPLDDGTLVAAATVLECLNAIEWLGGALTPSETTRRLEAMGALSRLRRQSFLDFTEGEEDDVDEDDFDEDDFDEDDWDDDEDPAAP